MNAKMEIFKKGAWTLEEDKLLSDYIKRYSIWNWSLMAKAAGLSRSGKSCRLRWMNYLRPTLKRECYSTEEIQMIIKLHASLGNKWSKIAEMLPGRTDNDIKNFFNTHLKKRLYNSKPICLNGEENKHGNKPKRRKHSNQKRPKSPTKESMLPEFETPQSFSSHEESFTSSEGNEIQGDLTIEPFFVEFNMNNSSSNFEEHGSKEYICDSFDDDVMNWLWLDNVFVEAEEVEYQLW